MARLPTAADINRPVPQATEAPRQGVVSYTPGDGIGLQKIGRTVADYADQQIAAQDDLEAAHVGSQFTLAYANTMNDLDNSQDYSTLTKQYADKMNATKDELLSQVNPRVREKMAARLDGVIAGGYDNVLAKANAKWHDYTRADTFRAGDDLGEQAANAKSAGDFEVAKMAYNTQTQAAHNAGAISEVDKYNLNKKWQNDNAKIWYSNQSPDKQLEILGQATRAVSPVEIIMNNELAADGKVIVSSDGDGQAIGGINSVAYPDQFAEAKKILEADGQVAAKKYISDFYQKEIIQKNGVENLPAGVQDVVADGLVNHWSGFQKELLSAAKAGKSRDELLSMRQAEYERLATENPAKYGKNLEGWTSRLDNLSHADGTAPTGSIFDYMDSEDKHRILNGKDTIVQKALDNRMAENPSQFIADLSAGHYNGYLDAAQVEKYKGNAATLIDKQDRQAADVRIATNAVYHKDIYDKIQAAVAQSDPTTAFSLVSDLRQNLIDQGQPTQFADDVRSKLLKTNPYSEEEKAQIYTGITDRWNQLKENAEVVTSKGVTDFNKKGTTLENVVHLQQDMMTAKLSGVKGMDSFINKLSPVIRGMAQKEQGKDDEGWGIGFGGWNDPAEPYDKGYQIIQDYLVKQEKTNDLPLKARMLQDFIRQADKMPEDVQKDPAKRDVMLQSIASRVIGSAVNKGMRNIPLTAIERLRKDPKLSPQFDEMFGSGAADRVLGRK